MITKHHIQRPPKDYIPRRLVSFPDTSLVGTVKVLLPRSKKELAAFVERQREEAYQHGCRDVMKRQASMTTEATATAVAGGQMMRQENICLIMRAAADVATANAKITYAMSQILARANGEQGGWK